MTMIGNSNFSVHKQMLLADSNTHVLMDCQRPYCVSVSSNWDRDLMTHETICYLALFRKYQNKKPTMS